MKHTFSLTVDVDPNWIRRLVRQVEVFGPDSAGHWLRGVALDPQRGWLCWEDDGAAPWGREPGFDVALNAWESGRALPSRWHRLDRRTALRAWEEGVRRWGADWRSKVDGPRDGIAVQLALLGEVRYG